MGLLCLSTCKDMPDFAEFCVTLRNIFTNCELGLSAILFQRYRIVYIVYRKCPAEDMPYSRIFLIKNSLYSLFRELFFRTISIILDIQFTYI
jgi:hypothetical protein